MESDEAQGVYVGPALFPGAQSLGCAKRLRRGGLKGRAKDLSLPTVGATRRKQLAVAKVFGNAPQAGVKAPEEAGASEERRLASKGHRSLFKGDVKEM